MRVHQLLTRLVGVRRNGNGWSARCPAHDDREPSLSVSEGEDGRILLTCHAGCPVEAICEALGLVTRDLFPAPAVSGQLPERRWQIRDESGRHVATHHRVDTDAGKKVWWSRPGVSRGLGELRTADLPLYAVERLRGATEVVIAEGEPATDALLAAGIPAVGTVTGASGTPGETALRPLVHLRVVLWPDHDAPGRGHMRRIAERLRALGCRDVRVVNWGRAAGDDAADASARGEDLRKVIRSAAIGSTTDPAGEEVVPTPTIQWTPFPVDVLPEPFGRFVRETAEARQCDPAAVALPMLSALAAAIGNSRVVRIWSDWYAPSILWTALVCPSGAVKTPAFRAAIELLDRLDRRARTRHEEALASFEITEAQYQAELTLS